MTIREHARRLRLFYRSWRLFQREYVNYRDALWFPFVGDGRFVPRRGGVPVVVPRAYWTMLPTAARLCAIDAHPRWVAGRMEISYRGYTLVAPPIAKMIGNSLREIFVEDVYRLDGMDLHGKVVVDIGAYIGDSSIVFAAGGARVHAFEPVREFHDCLEENIRRNDFTGRITAHAVGLTMSSRCIEDMTLVNAMTYLREHDIRRVDILKLDCEGCEYELFADDRLLRWLDPQRVILEYHRGGRQLHDLLRDRGYAIDWPERTDAVGYLYARRSGATG